MKSLKLWWHKVTHFEYWPFGLFYLPVYFYFGYLCLKHRSFFFFTAANPGIEFGGMLGEKKWDIYQNLPSDSYPKTLLCFADTSTKEILEKTHLANISFPFIVKPNIGERGKLVEKIDNLPDLHRYLKKINVDFLIQEYIDYPIELGVFYVRLPGQEQGNITSVTRKDFLKVIGDGQSTIESLLSKNKRALLTFDFHHIDFQEIKQSIPIKNEIVLIEPIGNHCRGTSFLDVTATQQKKILKTIDAVAQNIDGFYFGRFDIRCKSLNDLSKGKNWSIIELNGAGAEPGHVYQPGFGIIKAYRDILKHLKLLSQISSINHAKGYAYWTLKKGIAKMLEIRFYNRMMAK